MRGIAFHSKQGGGKTTTARAVHHHLQDRGVGSTLLSFAEPLKEATRNTLLSMGVDVGDPAWKYRHREQLQVLGATLRGFHEDIWVDLLIRRAYSQPPGTVILVDDMRYWNEAHALREAGFMLVHLEVPRDLRQRRVTLSSEDHASETDLDAHPEVFHLNIEVGSETSVDDVLSTVLDHWNDFEHTEGMV